MTKLSHAFVLLASARGHMRDENWLHAYFAIETAMDVIEEAMKEEDRGEK